MLFLIPAFASAHSRQFYEAQARLKAARQQAALHEAELARAQRKAAADSLRAAVLARQQVAAAARVRHLEDQTAQAAATLDELAAQAKAAESALRQNEAALETLLPVMERLAREPAASMLAVPAPPRDAIRGILVLQGLAAEIGQRARAVQVQAAQLAALQAQATTQQAALSAAVATQQQAEAALTAEIAASRLAETSDLDISARAAAAEAAATHRIEDLQSVIAKLQAKEQEAEAARPAPPGVASVGKMAAEASGGGAPVAGFLVQTYGAPTVAGPAVGIVYRAAPGARVTAPCSGPVLYANAFQNYGLLVILDCGKNYDFVLSGMLHLDATAGQMIERGQPVGEMAGYDPSEPTRQPMLYVELRRNGKPVNPALWLNGGGSG